MIFYLFFLQRFIMVCFHMRKHYHNPIVLTEFGKLINENNKKVNGWAVK